MSLCVIAVVSAPVVYWLIVGEHDLVALYGSSLAPKAHSNRLQETLVGLGLSIYAPLGFLFPLDIILPVLFPATVPKAWADIKRAFSPAAWTGSEPDWPLLTLHITIGGFLLLMLGALLTGATHYLERYMHPFFLLTPLWMLSVVERTERRSQGQGPGRHPRRVVPHCVPHQGKGLASCDGASLQQMPDRHALCGARRRVESARLRGRNDHCLEPA